MNSMLVSQYQSRVIGPTEIIDYSSLIMQNYPPQAIAIEPFVGLKVLCRDANSTYFNPADRLRQIDMNLGFLRGKGCIIRETAMAMPDGFWIITLPVPKSQVNQQLHNLFEVLSIFEGSFGIGKLGLVEINVSGRCNIMETERCLSGVMIPQRYMPNLVMPENMTYRLGNIVRINDNFMVFRTRWNLDKNMADDLMILTQLLTSIYH